MGVIGLLLPVGIAFLMISFTLARKAGLAHYLKPHQYSIAVGSAWSVLLSLLAAGSVSAKALAGTTEL